MAEDPKKKPVPPQEGREDELAPEDDKVIGKAFKWSLVAAIIFILAGAGGFWFLRKKEKPLVVRKTELPAPKPAARFDAVLPKTPFTDITRAAGIDFSHNNGAYGDKLLPETMGGGVAFFDMDQDGDQDLYFVNSTYWPGKIPAGKHATLGALYQNDGQGNFTNVTAESGLEVSFYGMGVAVGDYDNDGRTDLFVSGVGGGHLFHNEGKGKFKETTQQSGVGGKPGDWQTSCAWIDYNNDGKLDLFVGNYVRWSREIDLEVGYKLVGFGRAFGQPMNFEGTFPSLYRNDGNGRFTDVSAASGIQIKNRQTGVPAAKALGLAPADLDQDGWIDIILANDTVQNFVFHNQKDGTFKEIGAISSIAFDSYGATRGAMGIDSGDFRNDGSLGVVIGNFANEMTALYVSQKDPLMFSDEALTEGIGPASRLLLKFGVFFFDFDLDGRLDVLTANGHLEEEIHKLQESQQYRQPAQLFWNSGRNSGCFVSIGKEHAGEDLFKPLVGRGSAFADIDQDGDLDVVLTQVGGPPLLLRNDQKLNRNWIRFLVRGKENNRDAIGAVIKLRSGGTILSRQVNPTRSYLSQSELPVTFGLGKTNLIDQVEVRWTGGKTQIVENVAINQMHVIEEMTSR